MRDLQSYHEVWLSLHPHRDKIWLRERLKDGFDIHHIDGDHSNNDPLNLVLIDSGDHMMLHNGKTRMSRVGVSRKKKPRKVKVAKAEVAHVAVVQHENLMIVNNDPYVVVDAPCVLPERLANGMLSSCIRNAWKR